ncbi:head-tail connector protein [Fructilactobacillus sp. Tb1]|uniref:head-tail connector protein n=1 Tax=Fructilactobacillus sp. Tb1 TaxID=3422304 RepID=UPI003D293582
MNFYLDTDEDLKNIKSMLRILSSDDDDLLRSYLNSAEISMQTAVGTEIDDFYTKDFVEPLYKTGCYALAGTLYTYRISTTDSTQYTVDSTYNSIVGTLRGLYLQEESDDNG